MTFSKAMNKLLMYYNVLELGHGEIVDAMFGLSIKDERLSSWALFSNHFL